MANLQTKAVVSEAFEQDGLLHIIVEVYVEDKDKLGEKLKILSRSPLSPLPIGATDQDIIDAAAGAINSYFPPDPVVKLDRADLVGLELATKDGAKIGTEIRIK